MTFENNRLSARRIRICDTCDACKREMNEEKKSNIVDRALARLNQRALVHRDRKPRGSRLTVADVLTVFIGAKIVNTNGHEEPSPDCNSSLRCEHCDKLHIPEWRRGGKIVERKWPDGRSEFACHYCGWAYLESKKFSSLRNKKKTQ